jgi:predicted transcriptional regulator
MEELKDAGFIIRSGYRKQVFKIIDKPIMPSQIQKQVNIRLTHVTRELRILKERGIVKILNPDERTGRLYQLTSKGQKLKEEMTKSDLL